MNNMLIRMAGQYVLHRLGEASTWASIAAAIALESHVQFSSDFSNKFAVAGVALAALLGVVIKDGWQKKV
jgi:hypothetical protein